MIITFIDSYYKGLYGAPKSMLSLAEGLIGKGCEVKIITTKCDLLVDAAKAKGISADAITCPTILVKSRLKFSFHDKLLYPIFLFIFWCKLLFVKNFNKVDVICINDIRSFLLFLPIIIKFRKKIFWYVRINDRLKYLTSIAAFLSKGIILISMDCYKMFSKHEVEIYKEKFFVIHTGFDFSDKTNDSNSNVNVAHKDNDVVFISVGSICERKNQKVIIDAFSKLKIKNKGKHLYLLGSPPSENDFTYYDELVDMINDKNISSMVTLIPHTPFVKEYLSMANIFLFASHKEGLPRVIIEAIYAGCNIVTSLVDGVTDIIISKDLGLVTSSKASEVNFDTEFLSLMEKSIELPQDKELKREIIKKKFSYEKYINNFLFFINN